jgi:MFS family permease
MTPQYNAEPAVRKARIPASIWTLGFVSMLMDVSSEMIHSLLPLFLAGSLGMTPFAIGVLEGLAESTALFVKVFSGAASDWLGKRKPLALAGYLLGALTKPFFAIATSAGPIVASRLIDRVGKGIRTAPRDALITDLTPHDVRGAAFGLRQSLDTIGAFVGPLLAAGLMLLWANDFRLVFWVAVIPAFLSVGLFAIGIAEPATPPARPPANPLRISSLKRLDRSFWGIAALAGLFTLARFSEAFLILRVHELGVPTALAPLTLVAMSLVYAATAYPFGRLSDRMPHKVILAWGLLVLMAADVLLARAQGPISALAGILLWGGHMGMTQGLFSAMISRRAPDDLRGTAFGVFNVVTGIAMLLASVSAGLIWDWQGSAATFWAGAAFAALSLASLIVLKDNGKSWQM